MGEDQKASTESNDDVMCHKEYSEKPKYVTNSDPIISTSNGDHLQTPPSSSFEVKELSVTNGDAKINMNNVQCLSDVILGDDQSRDATSVENGRMEDNHNATKGENDSVANENSSEQSDICSTENPVVADCDTCNKFDDCFVVPKNGDDVSRSDSSSSSNSTSSSYQSTSSSSSSVSDDRGTVKMCQSETFDENQASDGQIPRSVSCQVLDEDETGDDFEDCSMATSVGSESPSLAASLPPNPTTPCHRDKRRTRLSRESKAKMKALDQKDKLFGRNDSIDCQGDEENEVSIAEIRSISTPNLKRAAALSAVASPYQTFESSPYQNLDNGDGDEKCETMTAAASPSVEGNGYITSSSEDGSTGTGSTVESGLVRMVRGGGGESEDISDSEWGSADELDHHVLKTYRRPLRPAALASSATSSEKPKTTGRPEKASPSKTATPKRHRKLKKSHSQKSQNDCDTTTSPVMSLNSVEVGAAPVTSVYVQKKLREGADGGGAAAATGISLPKNPFGFDSALASQVASKARLFTGFTKKKAEEVFGDSD